MLELFKLFLLETMLLYVGGIAFFGGKQGLLGALTILTILNGILNYYLVYSISDLIFWQIWLLILIGLGIIIDIFLNRRTSLYKLVSMSMGSLSALFLMGILISLLPAILIWSLLIGIPILFSYRNINKLWMTAHVVFKLSLALGLIVIGNLIY